MATIHPVKQVTLALLPFENSSDNNHEHFASGFGEDLIVDLARYSGLQIISSYTAGILDAGDGDIFEAAQEISIDYLLKSNIRISHDSLRINTQLLNTASRTVLWAERYDALLDSFLEVQDSIVEQIVFAIQSEVEHDLLSVARRKPPASLQIYDCWLRGMAKLGNGTIESNHEARELFKQAIEIDPTYARAYAGLSLSHFNEWSCQLWELYEESEHFAYHYAVQASQLDDTDHLVHMILGRVYLYRRQFDQAENHIDKSLKLNSSDADNLIQLATCLAFLGRVAEAERLVEKALRLNPYRNLWYHQYGSFVHFVKKDYQRSIDRALKRQLTKIWVDLPAYIAAAYAYLGDTEQAKTYMHMFIATFKNCITKGKTPTPEEMIDWVKMANPFKYDSDTDNIVEGLERAGIGRVTNVSTTNADPAMEKVIRSQHIFKKEQAVWRIQYDNKEISLTNMKGLQDINRLLQAPETDVHCTDLMGATSSMDETSFTIDEQARQAYKQHIKDIEEDMAEAEEHNDLARSVKLKKEYDQLLEHLSQSLGVGNRTRKLNSPAERARAAVTMRIKKAVKRISDHHPSLGKHLVNSIKTGVYCTYTPEGKYDWLTD